MICRRVARLMKVTCQGGRSTLAPLLVSVLGEEYGV